MNSRIYLRVLSFLSLLFVFFESNLNAGVLLPCFFSDNMVLQRGVPLKIFGDGVADEQVTVEFNGQKKTIWPDEKTGKWTVELSPMKADSVPRMMYIKTKSGTFTIKNVLVGDVWFCAGEEAGWSSLGRLPSSWAIKLKGEKADVRIFEVSPKVAGAPQAPMFLSGVWRSTDAKNASKVSGVAYLFAKAMHDELKIPIGVVNARFAGSSIQSWIGLEVYKTDPLGKRLLARWNKKEFNYQSSFTKWKKALEKWEKRKSEAESKKRKFRRKQPEKPLGDPGSPMKSAGLHNSAIAPFKNFRICGFVWSQGAADDKRIKEYSAALALFSKSSRTFWGDKELPLILIQPAPAGAKQKRAVELRQKLAYLRSKQISAAVKDPKISLVSRQDLGWASGLPRFDLARRLALTALAAVNAKGGRFSPMAGSVEADGKKVRIAFSGTDSGLIGRDVHQFTGDYASLVGKNIKIVRKGKKKRITPIASENGERKVIKAVVELRGKNGELIKRLKTVWDKTYADPVRDFRMAETKLTAEERKTWKQRRAKLAEERKRKAEEKKKREAARREQMKKNGEEPPPSLPKKPKPPATPPKAVEPQSKGTVKTTFYMLNSKKLLGFAASGEKSRMSWISAVIDGDAVVLSRRGNDPITRVRYGCADNPKCSLWGKNGLPVFPFDKKVSRK